VLQRCLWRDQPVVKASNRQKTCVVHGEKPIRGGMAMEEGGIDQLIANVKAAKRQSTCIVHGEKPTSGSESTGHRHRSIVGEA